MLHNEARNLLVEAYKKTHDAKGQRWHTGYLCRAYTGWQNKRPEQEV